MLSIFKETTVHTFMLAFSSLFVRLILLHNLFFLPLESHEQMTILQVIAMAYKNNWLFVELVLRKLSCRHGKNTNMNEHFPLNDLGQE